VFARTRLFQQMENLANSPAIWLWAAPGSGKSTLLATWLAQKKSPCLWLQLDAHDAQPSSFVACLDQLFSKHLELAHALPALRPEDFDDLTECLKRRLCYYLEKMPSNWTLVLDNFQHLSQSANLEHAIASLLRYLPNGVQWIFASREAPSGNFSQALISQQIAVLSTDALRFDAMETQALIDLHQRTDLSAEQLAIAQGWAGGLTLILLSGTAQARGQKFSAQHSLLDYFATQVIEALALDEQKALCSVALLPDVSAEEASELSGYSQAGALLARLADQSLFTDLRPGQPPRFVFHALFSDFLLRWAQSLLTNKEWVTQQTQAAHVLLNRGDFDVAIELLIQAQQWSNAQVAIERHAAQLVLQGKAMSLQVHLDRLPHAQQSNLTYWRAMCALDAEPARAIALLEAHPPASHQRNDQSLQLLHHAALCNAKLAVGELTTVHVHLRAIDRLGDLDPACFEASTALRWMPGLLAALVHHEPWHPALPRIADQAEALLHLESSPGQRLVLGSLALHFFWTGQIERVERLAHRIDELCKDRLATPATLVRWWNVGILIKTLLGKHAAASFDAQHALNVINQHPGLALHQSTFELAGMLIELAQSNASAASKHLQRAERALHPQQVVNQSVLAHQKGMLAMLEGNSAEALRLMQAAAHTARGSGYAMREHIALIAQALAQIGHQQHQEADASLKLVFSHPFYAYCKWHQWVANIVAAFAKLRTGEHAQALEALGTALRIAKHYGYRFGPMLFSCGSMMAELCAFALRHRLEKEVACSIILKNNLRAPVNAPADWPWAIRIYALDQWRVLHHDAPITQGRKESRRLQDLLALLTLSFPKAISVEAITDTLWPEAEGDQARNTLDNALFRLRKLLGSEDSVLARQGMMYLNPQLCWTDLSALEPLLATLSHANHAEKANLEKECLRLYGGPQSRGLLPQLDFPLVLQHRDLLRRRMQNCLSLPNF
jgi:LuxR family transcriptional regulator, maltose regulon positive regulatory protein